MTVPMRDYVTTTELAKLLGLSHVAVYKKIKKGQIKAVKIGRNYIVSKKELAAVLGTVLTKESRKEIQKAVRKAVREYGETLRLLGRA